MKLAARIIVTMIVALGMVPVFYANDAPKAATEEPKVEATASPVMPDVAPEARRITDEMSPPESSDRSESLPADPPLPAGKVHGLGGSGNFPRVEWFLGYSFWRAMPTSPTNRIGYLHGGSTSVALNLNKYVGLVADFGGYGNSNVTLFTPTSSQTVNSNGTAYTFLFGPRFSFRKYERFTPFVQALFGGVHASAVTIAGCTGSPECVPLAADNTFAATVGAGFDIKITRHIALRLFQGEFLLTDLSFPVATGGVVPGWRKNVRLSSGIVFRFGGEHPAPPPPANRPPTASCSADKAMVYLGSGDSASITASASDPDNDPLTYSWSASGGSVDGTGAQVRWLSAGTAAGTYTISARVDDGRGGVATCSADVRVEPKPNHPPTIACSANPSSVFAGERSRITCKASDPDGDPLTYTWRADAGRITGDGPNGDFDTTGLSPGTYNITAGVDDGRGGTAAASTPAAVKPVPPPPQASKMGECAFGKPLSTRIDNVCKRTFDDVALRLQNEPHASAVIIGYSDPKERRPAQIAKDRAANAAKYLGEKGIDASRVTTRTGDGQAGAKDNRRLDIMYVPDGATY